MPDNPLADDMKDLWRNQSTEQPQISFERFRDKARRLQKRTKREVYTAYAIALVLLVWFIFALTTAQQAVQRLGLGILTVWAVFTPLRVQRILLSRPRPDEAGDTFSIAFYRSLLERHRDHQQQIWLWLAALFLGLGLYLSPAIAAIAQNPNLAPKVLPFSILLAIWVVLFVYIRGRKLGEIRRQLDSLAAFEKEIHS